MSLEYFQSTNGKLVHKIVWNLGSFKNTCIKFTFHALQTIYLILQTAHIISVGNILDIFGLCGFMFEKNKILFTCSLCIYSLLYSVIQNNSEFSFETGILACVMNYQTQVEKWKLSTTAINYFINFFVIYLWFGVLNL